MMKSLAICIALAVSACELTPTERTAIGQGVSALAVTAIDRLSDIGQNPVAVSQATHDLMAFGCGIVEEGGPLLGTLIDIALARAQDDALADPAVNQVSGAEILGYVKAGCAVLASLPIKSDAAPEVAPEPAPSPVAA